MWQRLFQRRYNYETAVGPRLVSHPESAPSVDDIPSDSLCPVAGALAAFPCRASSWRDVWCSRVAVSLRRCEQRNDDVQFTISRHDGHFPFDISLLLVAAVANPFPRAGLPLRRFRRDAHFRSALAALLPRCDASTGQQRRGGASDVETAEHSSARGRDNRIKPKFRFNV